MSEQAAAEASLLPLLPPPLTPHEGKKTNPKIEPSCPLDRSLPLLLILGWFSFPRIDLPNSNAATNS